MPVGTFFHSQLIFLMKSFIHFGRFTTPFFLACFLLSFGQAAAQTTLISPTGDGGFENGATFAANGWTLVNGATNQWFLGAVAPPSAGANCAYISDNATGTTYNYINTAASTVHFYRDIAFPAGQTNITLSFKWKVQGEGNYDYVTVFSMPTSGTPAFNSPVGAFQSWLNIPTAYSGAVIACTPPNLNLQSTYQTQTACLPTSFAGTTQRIVFMWSNDGSAGTQPPGSMDEISLVSNAAPTVPANQPTALTLTPTASSIAGAFTAAASAPNGYLVVRTATNVPPAAPVNGTTYTPGASALGGVIIASGAATTFTATGLTPGTPYFFWVYSFNGGTCGGASYLPTAPLTASATTNACSITGTRTVGPTGNYLTLTAAITDLNALGIAGPVVLELQSTYLSSAEPAFPVVLPAILCGSSVNNVTIRPALGATALSIAGANAGPAIDINGGAWWRIDGRPGGVGTAKELTITNSSTTGQAIRFINEGSNNIVRNCTVSGVNTSTASGVVLFSTTTGTNGNDNNLIDNCDIRDGATTPTICIYSLGTTSTQAQYNSNNTVSNCNIFNFFISTSTSFGIQMTSGSTDWTVTGNSFYQTAARTIASTFTAINMASNITNNFVISNNFIGGSGPLCSGGAMTLLGTGNLRAINATVGPGLTTVQGNTIRNINYTTTNATNFNGAIVLGQGNFNCTGNTVGSLTANNDIVVSASGTAFVFNGIILGGTSPTNVSTISNNNIGGISLTVTGAPATVPSIRGISVQGTVAAAPAHNVVVTGNTIGSTTVANNITSDGNLTGALIGIVSFSNALGQQITNNTVANLTATNAGTANILWGILAQGSANVGSYTITGNTVRNLTSGSGAVGSGGTASILAVQISINLATSGANVVSQNTVHSLLNNNPTVAASVTGMIISVPLVTSNIVARNLVHSMNLGSSALTGIATGIQLNGGVANVQNNMVRLGVDAAGADIQTGYSFIGIRDAGGTHNVHFNSVYIGGAGVSAGSTNTFAFSSLTTTGTRNFVSNIFYNARSNGAGTGKHYATSVAGAVANPAGLSSNYNDLFATGTGGFVGLFNALDQATLANWRTATGLDFNSVSVNPNFIAPNGTTATLDLHLQAGVATALESGGQPVLSATDDYDGQTRSSLTPTDIGADAGNFPLSDISGPGIAFTPIAGTCGTGNIALNGVAITDGTGIPVAGALVPRIYYRKNAGAWFSSPGTLASGNALSSVWNFNIIAADLGGLAATDVVSYYVIAQDVVATPNIGSNFGGVVATDVNTVTTHPVTPNTATVQNPLIGTFTVGAGGAFATLTAAAAAYNTSCLGGPVVFSLTDATYPTETFPITFNQVFGASAVNTLTIRPAAGVNPVITGASTTALIKLNGADFVTIDGSNNGTNTRNLTFSNTNATTSAVLWNASIGGGGNGANNNTFKNLIVIGGASTVATIYGIVSSATGAVGTGGDDNDNFRVENCAISKAYNGISILGSSVLFAADGLVITQNVIGDALVANYVTNRGIEVNNANSPIVSLNTIFNIITLTTASNATTGIDIGAGVTDGQVVRNNISAVYQPSTGGWNANGIHVSGAASTSPSNLLIANNFISDIKTVNYVSLSAFNAFGIRFSGGFNTKVYHNTINMFGEVTTGTSGPGFSANIYVSSTLVYGLDVRNNILSNTQNFNNGVGGLAYNVYYGSVGVVVGTSNFNDYYGGAPTATTTWRVGFDGTNQRPTLADWRLFTGQDQGSYSVAPVFVSNTDLHLATDANFCLDGGGTPLASVPNDYDNQVRNLTTPDIGADEFTLTGLSITVAETSGPASNDGITCSGAPATLTAVGGGTYVWSTGATTAAIVVNPTTNTAYTVTITNNGCPDVVSTTITVLPLPAAGISVAETSGTANNDGITCSGASATLTASGGGTYLWSTNATSTSISVNPTMTTTYTVTVTNSNNCFATATFTIAVNAAPTVSIGIAETSGTANNDGTTCTGASVTLTATGVGTYQWSTNATTAAISVAPTATTIYTVTLTNANNCTATASVTITVNPLPVVGITPVAPAICAGTSTILTATGGSGYLWSTTATTAAITVSPAATTTYTVTVTNANVCANTASNTVTINALPVLSVTSTQPTTCVATNGSIDLTVSGAGTFTYNWSGVGIVQGQQDQSNLGVGTYNVTVTNSATGCFSTLSIALIGPGGCSICPVIGLLTAPTGVCNGSAAALTASGLTDMGVTYGIEFKYSIVALANPYVGGTTIATVPNNGLGGGGTTAATSFTFPTTGSYFVYAILSPVPTDPSCRPSRTATVVVNPVPTVNAVSNQTYCPGNIVPSVVFSSQTTGPVTFNWTRTAEAIGLAATSGTGNIPGFTATNVGTAPLSATFTVTASFTANGATCTGTPMQFIVTVNPTPTIDQPASQTACNGNATAAVGFTGTVPGTVFTWTNNTPSIGLGASGTGDIASFTAVNTGAAPVVATITVSATFTNNGVTCPDGTRTFTITVNPTPTVNAVASQVRCAGTTTAAVTFSGAATGTVFNWTNNTPAIGLAASGTGNIASFTTLNVGTAPVVATITVTPSFTNAGVTCTGASTTFTITVNPNPTVNAVANQTICAGTATTAVTFGSPTTGTTFTWTNSNTAIGLAASGTGNIASFTATNTGLAPISGTITVTPSFTNGATTCTGASTTFTITVNPTPNVAAVGNQLLCSETATTAVSFTGTVPGTVFNWTNNTPAIGLAASGTGNIASFIAANPGSTVLTATITVTPVFTSGVACSGAPITFTITVNPAAKVNVGLDQVICQNQVGNLNAVLTGGATSGIWTGGAGVFGSTTSPATTYTPAASEYGTTVTLTFTSNDPAGPCVAASDALTVTINTLPIVTAGVDVFVCEGTSLTLSKLGASITANGSGVTTGSWSTSGTGTFQPSAAFPAATTYVPSAADIAAGFVTLRLTSADPAGPCNSVSDFAILNFHEEKSLICNDLVYVSLDIDCVTEILPDDILEGAFDTDEFFKVVLTSQTNVPIPTGNVVNASDVGKTYKVKVTDLCSGNYCWGEVKIEDKLAPTITCTDITLTCAITTYTPAYITGFLGIAAGTPTTFDCSAITLSYDDTWTDLACGASINGKTNVSAYIKRDWLVKDAWNNFSTCTQFIYLERRGISAVKFPVDINLTCSNNVNTNPSNTGAPFVTDFGKNWPLYPDQGACELNVVFEDQILPVCGNSYKILRKWTVYDWCLPTSQGGPNPNPFYFIQVIKVIDNQGPTIACPGNLTVSTDPFTCCGTANLPDVIVSDNCNKISSISASVSGIDFLTNVPFDYAVNGSLTTFPGNNLWNPDTLGVLGSTPCLPLGQQTVKYTVEDLCGNTTSCVFQLTIDDQTPPQVACVEFTQVALGVDGMALINATTFDKGSFDNCAPVSFKVRRMAPNDCQADNAFHDQAKFCCSDIGDTITVILRVYDVPVPAGDVSTTFEEENSNDCMVRVFVEDKLKPTCSAPANMTVTCENFDPSLWVYGFATSVDNCCIDTITTTTNYSQFDTLCNRGTITRTFRAFDCGGNTSICTQRIFVTYEQDYFVRFPDDRIISVCDGTGNYGEPTFLNKDCELLGVSFTDEVFTVVPDACFKIERTWHIINWCFYNANLPLTNVPNPNPNATVNAPANNPGPVVSSSSNPNVVPAPWTATRVAVTPGAAITDYSSFWSLTTNGYSYKQIIKIIDTQDPTVDNCPASPVTFCDLTPNDPQLWNETNWWDGGIESHNLCEGPADLNITATDACTGAAINIRYLLFLDLDNNGSMETVISSTNLPGFNNVQFNNAQNPNFTGGVSTPFDERLVPSNQKYGFALQTTVVGNKKTAAVRWNTLQSPNTFVIPELPYGTHKIKWIVEDGCGNEAVCEYTFIVKDCKAPTVVCLNGLSVNIMPTGMIALWASDFLQYTEDNCTPTNKLRIAIRRVGQADGQGNTTGFPRNADGTPQTSVTFTCADLGTQEVELWSIDLAGNADFCVTYVIIQDNAGNCVTGAATVAGFLKTEDEIGLEEAIVELNSQGAGTPGTLPFVKQVFTDESGAYMFNKMLPLSSNATVTPVKDVNPLNGVTTYDLVLISKHILGLEPLTSEYKMIAADANKSGSITTFDIVELRKLILGIYTELPNNTSWRFVEKAFAFPDPLNPFKTAFPENVSLANLQSNVLDLDFVAMKIGDVNGSAVANSLTNTEDRTAGTLLFDVQDRTVKAGEVFEVTFRAADKVQGYQMTLGLSGLTASEIVKGDRVGDQNFGVFPDALTVSVDGAQEFTVRFRAARSGKLGEMLSVSGRITKAEGYTMSGARQSVALRFTQYGVSTVSGVGFELYQNEPNPFVNKTFVGFHLPEAATATLTVFDESGRMLFIQKGDYAKGYNKVAIERELLGTTGLLYYKLETATDSATKKMIQTK